jgi:hypothetical protein
MSSCAFAKAGSTFVLGASAANAEIQDKLRSAAISVFFILKRYLILIST